MKLNDLTLMILGLNAALDTGKYDNVSIREVEQHIETRDIFEFLEARVGSDCNTLGFIDAATRDEISDELYNICAAYNGRECRKWGVKNRGLCILLAWVNELIQQRKFND